MRINLLPARELRLYYDKDAAKVKAATGVIMPLIIAALLYFSATASYNARKNDLLDLEQQYRNFINTENEIKQFELDIVQLKKRSDLLKSVLPVQFYWSEKLVLLTRLIPPEAWLDKLTVRENVLQVNGYIYAENSTERPIAILNRFIKNLNGEPSFSDDFRTIDLIDTFTTINQDKEVLEFELQMTLK